MVTPDQKSSAGIGKWKFPEKIFSLEKIITFKQTNVMGNTYFSNYVEWQGEAREKLLLCHPSASVYLKENPHIFLVTHSLGHRYIGNTYFGDRIRIKLTSKNILDYSLMIIFRYYNTNGDTLIGEGWQKVCFWDRKLNKPCKIPQFFRDLAEPIQEK